MQSVWLSVRWTNEKEAWHERVQAKDISVHLLSTSDALVIITDLSVAEAIDVSVSAETAGFVSILSLLFPLPKNLCKVRTILCRVPSEIALDLTRQKHVGTC